MDSSGSGVPPSSIFFILLFISIFRISPSSSVQVCQAVTCRFGPAEIRFPFWLTGVQDPRCGYPGFNLSCNSQGQAILNLPRSGDFVVTGIDYQTQSILLRDPDNCLSDRISNFSTRDSVFSAARRDNLKFFNCSLDSAAYNETRALPVSCLSRRHSWTILAWPSRYSYPQLPASSCTSMPNFSIPLWWEWDYYQNQFGMYEYEQDLVVLNWNVPDCSNCELMACGFKSDKGLEVGCANPPGTTGLSRGAKYGIIVGIGIPGLIILIGFLGYVFGKFHRRIRQIRGLDTEEPPSSSSNIAMSIPPLSVTIAGLDVPTIESYPKTVIGDSFRLPNEADGTCPICLSEYQPKETLRSIPECNHFFHALCIDEWLKLNRSCPLCRNSPETRSVTPCSSNSSAFSTTSSA